MEDDARPPLTLKELARLAGVSIGTVDRVLHRRGRVSAENIARIEALAAEYGYRPNLFASRLSGGPALRTVVAVLPRADQDWGYWSLLRQGLDRAASELAPLQVAVAVEAFDRDDLASCRAALDRAAEVGDAVVVAPIHSAVFRPWVEALGPQTPLVFVDSDMECQRPRSFVGPEPRQGGVAAARLLDLAAAPGAELGTLRFTGDDEHLHARTDGFVDRARAAGRRVLTLEQDLAAPAEVRRAEARAWLAAHSGVGGLFVPNASVAEYAPVVGGRALVGWDLTEPNRRALEQGTITYLLHQRPEVMAYEAVRRLGRALLFHEEPPKRILMPVDVVIAETLDGHLTGTAAEAT